MRFRRLFGAIAIGILMVFAAAPAAPWAEDDYLVGSDPQPQQELNETPGWVTLAFRTKANAKLAKILVLDAGGKNVTTGALIVEGTNVTSQLQFDLPQGTYSVYYRTSNGDGQPRGGAFQFAYGKGQWTPLDKEVWVGEAEQPPIMTNPDPNATETGTAAPTTNPTDNPSGGPTDASPQPSAPSPSGTAGPTQPGSDSANPTGWLIAAGVVVVGLLGGAAILYVRRNRAGGA